MARPLRVEYPGAVYHVTARGNARMPIFEDDRDRTDFLELLAEAMERFEWHFHAYCLMVTDHRVLKFHSESRFSAGDISPILIGFFPTWRKDLVPENLSRTWPHN
jgi:putative transposase